MFDYKKRTNQITIGYRINEAYWHRGIATETVALLIAYLCDDIGIQTIKAFVMPENKYSERVLMNNGFTKECPKGRKQSLHVQKSRMSTDYDTEA